MTDPDTGTLAAPRPRHRAIWLSIAGLTAIVLVAPVLWAAAVFFLRHAQDAGSVYRRPVSLLRVDVPAGQVTIEPGPPGEIRISQQVRWQFSRRPLVRRAWNGRTLTISVASCAASPLSSGCEVALTIRVPPALAAVSAAVGAGSLRLEFTQPPRHVIASVGTGTVTVSVPDSARYRVVATTGQFGSRYVRQGLVSRSSPRLITLSAGTGTVRLTGSPG